MRVEQRLSSATYQSIAADQVHPIKLVPYQSMPQVRCSYWLKEHALLCGVAENQREHLWTVLDSLRQFSFGGQPLTVRGEKTGEA